MMRHISFFLSILLLLSFAAIPKIQLAHARQTPIEIVANDALAERVSGAVVNAYTGGGFDTRRDSAATLANLCAGEFGILATTTPPTAEEFVACPDAVELLVGLDGSIVIISSQVDFLTCLEIDQLKILFGADGPQNAEVWNQLDANLPERRVSVFMPTDQTVRDFFYGRVIGEESGQRRGTEALGDEPYEAIDVRQGGIGFLSLAEYFSSPPTYSVVPLNNGTACQPPTERTIADGDYPAAAPVYWYLRKDASLPLESIVELLTFVFSEAGATAIQEVGAWPAPLDLTALSIDNLQGDIFGGALSGNTGPDFVVRLTWTTNHDLDLGLYLPGGTQVDFNNPAAPGFYRQADEGNDYCETASPSPHEEVIALDGSAIPTDYLAFVQLSLLCGNLEETTSFTLEFLIDGQVVNSATGSIAQGENPFVVTFSFPG